MTAGAAVNDDRPRVVETHSALLFFVADRVYKLKKPVDLSFLDFRTAAARRAACESEVTLNSRLAPDVYLGVAELQGPGGEPSEPLVVMRRMPERRRLSTLVSSTPQSPELPEVLTELGRVMASFHDRCHTSPLITAGGDPDALRRLWADTIHALHEFVGTVVGAAEIAGIETLAMAYLRGREPLLRDRQKRGLVRDGHGDLIADDIFILDDGPRILDCLEFDPRLRHIDVLNDVAFLAMDLERLGSPDAARRFLDAYTRFSGEHHPRSLEDHYIAYRALVRCKVSCLRFAQGDAPSASAAKVFSALALQHLQAAQVPLIVLGGLPGSGKSSLAEALCATSEHADWVVLSSDAVRKELAGLDPMTSAAAAYGTGLYEPRRRRRVYTELYRRAETALGLGQGVILDATFAREEERAAARLVAARASSTCVELECRADTATMVRRLAGRRLSADRHASDAGVEILRAMAVERADWPTAAPIDTTRPIPQSVEAAQDAIRSVLGHMQPPRQWT